VSDVRKYRVPTINRDTGDESYVVIAAESAEDAMKVVQDAGLITGVAELIDAASPSNHTAVPKSKSDGARRYEPPSATRPTVLFAVLAGLALLLIAAAVLVVWLPASPHSGVKPIAAASVAEPPPAEAPAQPLPPPSPIILKPGDPPSPSTPAVPESIVSANLAPDLAAAPPIVLDGEYLIIPVEGVIGEDVLAAGLEECLQQASIRGTRTVVFDLDSPGGQVGEAYKIADVLQKYDHLTLVARVKHAISAAMVFVTAADVILVSPDSTLGGAVAFSRDNRTGEVSVDAKMLSIWGAALAGTASAHGHNASIVWAMCVMEKEVYVYTDSTTHQVTAQGYPCNSTDGCRMIDGPSTVLTLDGNEAINLGFAFPVAGDDRVTVAQGFRESGSGRSMMEQAARNRRSRLADAEEMRRQAKAQQERTRREAEEIQRQQQQQELLARQQYEKDVADVTGLVLRIDAYIDDARAKHPRQYSDYMIDAYGNYTPTSIENWRTRSNEALRAWKDVRAGLTDIATRMKEKGLEQSEPKLKALVERLYDEASLEISRLDAIRKRPQ
jgi:hypothetical protein